MPTKPSIRRLLAGLTTTVLVAMAALFGALPASAATPQITVSEAPHDGGTITVHGTGFAAEYPGIYVGYGPASAAGFYQGGLEGAIWVAVGNEDGAVDAGLTAPMAEDGSFTVQLTVPAYAEGSDLAVFTSKAHGQGFGDPSQNTKEAIVYAAAVSEPESTTLSIDPASTEVEEDTDVTLTATVTPAAAGTVTFTPGGSAEVSGGIASVTLSDLPVGTTNVSAAFAPADPEAYSPSTAGATIVVTPGTETEPELPTPTVTVSQTDDLDSEGQTITVTGTGFVPNPPQTDATRAPVGAGNFGGAYVVFGKWPTDWEPSEGGSRPGAGNLSQRWGVAEAQFGGGVNAGNGGFILPPDGSFVLEFTVADSSDLEGNYGIYTYAGGGAVYAPFETFTPLTFTETEEPVTDGPSITVTPDTALDPAVENVLTVSGTGYVGTSAVNGVYVLVGEQAIWSGEGPLPASGWLDLGWVTPGQIVDGAFTTELTIPAGSLDPETSYHVATSAAHGLSITDRSLDAFSVLTVAEPSAPVFTISVTQGGQPVTAVAQGSTVEIVGGGFPPGELVTASIDSDAVTIGTAEADANGLASFTWTVPSDFETGPHTVTVSGASGSASASLGIQATTVSPPVGQCDAALAWGVKESFRNYVTGGIANGAITTSGVDTDGDIFVWSAPAGDIDPVAGTGSIDFGGSVSFTGHGGMLDLTFSDVTIVLTSTSTAQIVVDYTGTEFAGFTTPGDPISGTRVVLAEFDIVISSDDDAHIIVGEGVLAEGGVEAFGGFYAAGTEIDAFALVVPLSEDCVAPVTPPGGGNDDDDDTRPTTTTPVTPVTPVTTGQCVPLPESNVIAGTTGGATLSWGVKASFRNYVTGPIANGSISGGTVFSGNPGAISASNRTGSASFGGSVSFTGHGGELQTTFSNPRVQIHSATSATLYLDVASRGYAGSGGLNAGGVAFGNVSLPSPSVSGDTLTWSGASVTLTSEGARAFGGFYSAGEVLDPLTLTVRAGTPSQTVQADLPELGEGEVWCDPLASTGADGSGAATMAALGAMMLGAMLLVAQRMSARASTRRAHAG